MIRFVVALYVCFFSSASWAMSCGDILGHQEEAVGQSNILADVQFVLDQFEFPEEANVLISNKHLRRAIYDVFGGKDIYTGEEIAFEDMRIDHFVPSSKGGPDNIFNYVVTNARINSRKSAAFDPAAAIPMLSLIRTVYAPKVLQKYEDSIAKEAREREARRLAAEKKKALTTPEVKPPVTNRGRSQKVIGREVSFRSSNDERTIRSVILLKEYIDANPDRVQNGEVFISLSNIENIKLRYPDFSIEHAFQFMYDYLKVFADDRRSQTGGGRFFGGLHSSSDAKGELPEGTPTMHIQLDHDPFGKSPFDSLLDAQGGHIIDVNESIRSFFFNTSVEEFARVVRGEPVDMSYFRSDISLRLRKPSRSAINLLKMIAAFGEPVHEQFNTYYEVSVSRALSAGFGDLKIEPQSLSLSDLIGIRGNSDTMQKLIYSYSIEAVSGAAALSDFTKIRLDMPDSFFEWLRNQSADSLEATLSTVNFEYEIEIPMSAFIEADPN